MSLLLGWNIPELLQLSGSEGSLGMMHLSHPPPPPPPHGAELTMTLQPEALGRREDVPAVDVLGWNVLNSVLNSLRAALPAPAIPMEFCSSLWPSPALHRSPLELCILPPSGILHGFIPLHLPLPNPAELGTLNPI